MGFFSDVGQVFSNPVRAAEAVGTFGTSEIARSALGGLDPLAIAAPVGIGFMTGNPMQGVNVAGSIYSGQQAANAQRDANAQNIALAQQQMMFSAQQAQNQMAFQERMSSTSIQRAQKDMLAAGINPMLAPTAQESSPGGAMGSYTAAHVDPVPSVAMAAMSSAREGARLFQDISESKSRIAANAAKAGVDVQSAKEKSLWGTINESLNKFIEAGTSDVKSFSDKYGQKGNPSGSFGGSWLGQKLNSWRN